MNKTCTNCGWRKGTACTNPDKEEWGKESKRGAGEECQLWKNRRVCAECIFWNPPKGKKWEDCKEDREPLCKCDYTLKPMAGTHPACESALWRRP